MTIKEMVYQFQLGASRVDANAARRLKTPQIIIYLNTGMLELLMQRYGPNNPYRATLESIQKRIDEWQRLIVTHEDLDGVADSPNNLFRFNLTDTEQDYLFLLRASFRGTKGDCKNQNIRGLITESDDLDVGLDNPDVKPNFDWRETLYRLAQDHILAYTDGTFSLERANIDYLRYPKALDIAGYTHFDGSDSADVDCELPIFLHKDIITQGILAYEFALKHPGVESTIAAKQQEE